MLFIGGPADKRMIDIPDELDEYYFASVHFSSSTTKCKILESFHYLKQPLRGETQTLFVMTLEGITKDDLIRKLIQNYKEDRDNV